MRINSRHRFGNSCNPQNPALTYFRIETTVCSMCVSHRGDHVDVTTSDQVRQSTIKGNGTHPNCRSGESARSGSVRKGRSRGRTGRSERGLV